MLDLNEKAKSPISPTKYVPSLLLAMAMVLLLQTSPIDQRRDKYHPRIDQERDDDDNNNNNNPRMSAENSAPMKEKKEDDLRCKHSIIGETRRDQMR